MSEHGGAAHITTGDVFDDLGLSPGEASEAKRKHDLWRELLDQIEKQRLGPAELAQALLIDLQQVSHLLRGRLSRFSTAELDRLQTQIKGRVRGGRNDAV